jgi:hypothetical protein
MEDDHKILKVQYRSDHFLDHYQISIHTSEMNLDKLCICFRNMQAGVLTAILEFALVQTRVSDFD